MIIPLHLIPFAVYVSPLSGSFWFSSLPDLFFLFVPSFSQFLIHILSPVSRRSLARSSIPFFNAEAVRSSEISVNVYRTARRHVPEESTRYSHRCFDDCSHFICITIYYHGSIVEDECRCCACVKDWAGETQLGKQSGPSYDSQLFCAERIVDTSLVLELIELCYTFRNYT